MLTAPLYGRFRHEVRQYLLISAEEHWDGKTKLQATPLPSQRRNNRKSRLCNSDPVKSVEQG